jgi:hypothetical protein
MHPNIYAYVFASNLHTYTYMIHFLCIGENRSGLCVRAPVCDGDGWAVCARVGGLVLRARPEPETRNRASPARRCGPRVASARRLSKVRRRSTPTSARGTPRRSPRWPMYAPLPARRRAIVADALGRALLRRGRLCAAVPPMRACVRTRAGTRLRGALGVGTAARRGGSIHVSEFIVYIYVLCICMCIIYAYTCWNASGLYMRVSLCNGAGSAVCSHAVVGLC